jgi:hypothetical protein
MHPLFRQFRQIVGFFDMNASHLSTPGQNDHRCLPRFCKVLIGTLLLVAPARAEPTVAEIVSEATRRWEDYRETAGATQGEMTATVVEKPSGNVLEKSHWLIRQLGRERSSEVFTELGPAKSDEYAIIRNESYLFELERPSTKAPWAIKGFLERERGSPPLSEQVADDPRYTRAAMVSSSGLRLYSKFLSEMLDEPGFTVTAAENREEGLVRLTFTYEGLLSNFPLTRGWVDLDRENFFVIREYDSEAKWPDAVGSIHGTYEYSIESDGFPMITRAVREQFADDGKGTVRRKEFVTEFDLSRTIPVSESDFTLSAFGLPEPPGPSRSFLPTSVFFWTTALLLVGLLSLMAAARLNRR